ncbi:TetR/AcrR family transcriptional regulator [Bailinhaonella thermotolerans]|uniref:TetR/AcrR family transcriptional regulator n=1 Tax=Bailinhaonella thermotolerans TaxID=1070861 RepID=A0A3A4BGF0_9ACTN|nr:TetR/AcrR family transcriptional regulator [Bailinhaonella thermotolerans]RJL30382.1 TetR/AcrR family transcriptional regulator [Bailinhaonella thermotolerans]
MSRREGTRQRLFAAAVDLIAEQGYAATTVDAIAERAGVAKGTVFYNFGSKEALFSALLEDGIARLAATMRETVAGLEPIEALDALVRAELAFVDESEHFARLLLAEMWRTAWREAMGALRTDVMGVYVRVLRDAVDARLLREDLDVETAAVAVFGMVLTVGLSRRADALPVQDAHATLTDLLHGRIGGTLRPPA